MKCKCGFKFSEPGEFRNCQCYINQDGKTISICPKCGNRYILDDSSNLGIGAKNED